MLVGVYAGLVLLAGVVVPSSSSAAVAVATLVAAALFRPLHRRVQRAVNRRFNRAGYDAATVADGFAARLQESVDLAAIRDDLAGTVNAALEPAPCPSGSGSPDRAGPAVRASAGLSVRPPAAGYPTVTGSVPVAPSL